VPESVAQGQVGKRGSKTPNLFRAMAVGREKVALGFRFSIFRQLPILVRQKTKFESDQLSSDAYLFSFLLYRTKKGSHQTKLGSYLFPFRAYLFSFYAYLFCSHSDEIKLGSHQLSSDAYLIKKGSYPFPFRSFRNLVSALPFLLLPFANRMHLVKFGFRTRAVTTGL